MKKLLSIVLLFAILIPITGCKASREEIFFYYPRKEIVYGQEEGFIAREERDTSGGEKDLRYLMMLYLEGPISQNLRSPFPKGTTIEQLEIVDNTLRLVLSEPFAQLEGLNYTIACASIARTCFGLGNFERVEIISGSKTLTLTPNTVSLADSTHINDPK